MKEPLLVRGSPAWQCGNRQMASIHTDSKGDGTEKGIFKGDKGLSSREMVRNFITVRALNMSVVRKGRNCILNCCLSHTSLNSCLNMCWICTPWTCAWIWILRSEWAPPTTSSWVPHLEISVTQYAWRKRMQSSCRFWLEKTSMLTPDFPQNVGALGKHRMWIRPLSGVQAAVPYTFHLWVRNKSGSETEE